MRRELARVIWDARNDRVDLLTATDNLRTLVSLCHDDHIEQADKLFHAIANKQIQILAGKHFMKKNGIDSKSKVRAIRPNEILAN